MNTTNKKSRFPTGTFNTRLRWPNLYYLPTQRESFLYRGPWDSQVSQPTPACAQVSLREGRICKGGQKTLLSSLCPEITLTDNLFAITPVLIGPEGNKEPLVRTFLSPQSLLR